jgi:uncharacterized membrane protein
MEQQQRVGLLDVMRGFAVMVMVVGHSVDAVLSDAARRTDLFVMYDAVRGFTAPVFLFVAGFAFLAGTVRRWDDYRRFTPALRRRLSRILLLFLVGYALHFPFFSLNKLVYDTTTAEYATMLQVDVLHCVAAGLLLLQALVFLSPAPAAMARRATVLGAVVVAATPLAWMMDWRPVLGPVLAPYLNQVHPSIFPLFPFAGFPLAGAAAGHLYLRAREEGRETGFFRSVAAAGAAAMLAGLVLELLPIRVYPVQDFWKTSPNFFLLRIGAVLLVTAGFGMLRGIPDRLEQHVCALGRASLLVYAVHLLLVYGSAANDGLAQTVGRSLPYHTAFLVGLAMLLLMLSVVHGWTRLRATHAVPTRFLRYGIASTLLYFFVTKPW